MEMSLQNTTSDGRVELSTYFGDKEYADRVAKTYLVRGNYYEVDFIENDVVVETRVMKSQEGDAVYFHSESYADSCAENYVMGVIP